jgi:beta-N-acetylhexosaminidase
MKTLLYSLVLLFSLFAPVYADQVSDTALQEKIDQLFIVGFRGTTYETAPEAQRMLPETNIGGVILFDYDTPTKKYDRNIKTKSQATTLIKDLQSRAKTPLFISIDEEGGKVSRLKKVKGFVPTLSAAKLSLKTDTQVQSIAKGLGKILYSYGFNMDFAPVLDVNVNKRSPAIGLVGRSFSSFQSVVARKGIAFSKGLQQSNIIPVGKHYPGHGSAVGDTHKGFVDITKTFKQYELDPFKKACASGIPAIMVGHLYDSNVDATYPATLSKAHIDRLKNDLGCSSQVLITDDIDMKALADQYSRHDILVNAFNAGIDIVITSNNITNYSPEEFFSDRKIVFEAVKAGEVSEIRIDDAYTKVMGLKKKFKIIP